MRGLIFGEVYFCKEGFISTFYGILICTTHYHLYDIHLTQGAVDTVKHGLCFQGTDKNTVSKTRAIPNYQQVILYSIDI